MTEEMVAIRKRRIQDGARKRAAQSLHHLKETNAGDLKRNVEHAKVELGHRERAKKVFRQMN